MENQKEKGLIHIYCGDGKGKTTAAVGLSVRAAGSGRKVLFLQFLKGQESSELAMLGRLGITVMRSLPDMGFTWTMDESQKKLCTEHHSRCLREAYSLAQRGEVGMLVLDELLAAYHTGLIDRELVKKVILEKPYDLELVMTGRDPEPFMIDAADYVSVIQKQKHPYEKGISARYGIEW
jgi:cob(I)alamin adenosyltransferase